MTTEGIFFALAILAVCLLWAVREARRGRSARRPSNDEKPFEPSRQSLAGPEPEIPFSQRRRTFKICPDCRELVLLEASVCKHCGCALEAAAEKPPELFNHG